MKYIIVGVLLMQNVQGQAPLNNAPEFAETINAADLKKHLFSIASDSMQGRETATEGLHKAAAYIENQFRSNGLVPGWHGGYQQEFRVYRDSLMEATIAINDQKLKMYNDFWIGNGSVYNIAVRSEEVYFAGFELNDTTQKDKMPGKLAMVIPGAAQVIIKGKKHPGNIPDVHTLRLASARNGVTALMIVDEGFPVDPEEPQGSMYIHKKDSLPNTFFISDSVARLIMGNEYDAVKKKIKSGIAVPKTYHTDIMLELKRSTETLASSNVIGMIEGSDKKDEAIIITSHFDHLGKKDSVTYYGADDDGSGTVTVLELSEAFAKAAAAGHRPRRNIIFMTVSGEEKGLWGSSYYSDHPAFPLDKTSVDINIDMIGRVETGRKADSLNYIYVVGDNRMSSDLRKISESVNKQTFNFVLDYKFNDPADPQRIFYRSDHYNFAKNGVPAIFYFNGLHDDYHRPTDTPDKINYELLAKRAKLIFYTAWEMANRDTLLKRDLD